MLLLLGNSSCVVLYFKYPLQKALAQKQGQNPITANGADHCTDVLSDISEATVLLQSQRMTL